LYPLIKFDERGIKVKTVLFLIATVFLLSGCAGMGGFTQMQDTVAKFDQGVHSASTAQMSLFHQVQAAECNRNFYKLAFDFAQGEKVPLDLMAPCTNTELTDAQFEIRQKLLATITLYADALQTLASGTDDTNLSANSKNLVTNIQNLAKQQGFTAVTPSNTAALNTAVVAITNLILNHVRYKEIREAASAVQPELTTVVAELKAENLNDVKGLASKKETFANECKTAILSARDSKHVASFLEIVEAHNNLQSIFPSPQNADQMNKALDALVAANQSLAKAKNGGAIPEISDLISQVQRAVALANSSK